MQPILALSASLVIGYVCLAALFVTLRALFPHRLARTQSLAGRMPGRAFLVGLVNALFFAALALAFIALSQWVGAEVLGLPALLFVAVLAVGLTIGLAGVAQLVGQRIVSGRSDLQHTLFGTLALGFACLTPLVGWFILLPYVGMLGLGALVIGFFYRERPAPDTTPSA
jgi:hypothetical protein